MDADQLMVKDKPRQLESESLEIKWAGWIMKNLEKIAFLIHVLQLVSSSSKDFSNLY